MQDGHLTEAYLLRAEILRAMGSLTEAEADIDHLLEDEKAQPASEEAVMIEGRTADCNKGMPPRPLPIVIK